MYHLSCALISTKPTLFREPLVLVFYDKRTLYGVPCEAATIVVHLGRIKRAGRSTSAIVPGPVLYDATGRSWAYIPAHSAP
jgi:hypothetical protein